VKKERVDTKSATMLGLGGGHEEPKKRNAPQSHFFLCFG